MLKVTVKGNIKDDNVEIGQIRYNKEGMFVLIVKGECKDRYDAVVLKNDKGFVNPFDWNSKNQTKIMVTQTYPYIAEGKLEINS